MHRAALRNGQQSFPLIGIEIATQGYHSLETITTVHPFQLGVNDAHIDPLKIPVLSLGIHAQRHRGTRTQSRCQEPVWGGAGIGPATIDGFVGLKVMPPGCYFGSVVCPSDGYVNFASCFHFLRKGSTLRDFLV